MPHTIAENLTRLTTARTDIANAIIAKGGTVTAGDGFEEFPADIATIPSGGQSVERDDVNFYDYDGTIVDSYTASEFANLTAMPSNPSHDGLTAQGWNWSLVDAKAYVAKYGELNIGQMYITDDGKTRVYITLYDGRLSPVLCIGVNGSVDVDWGDGTAHSTLTGASTSTEVSASHTYAAAGDYVIALEPSTESSFAILGNSTVGARLLLKALTGGGNRPYQSAIKRIEMGARVTLGGLNALNGCVSLLSITTPSGLAVPNGAFFNTYSMHYMTIPYGATEIGSNAFYNSYSLKTISVSNTISSIGGSSIYACGGLTNITIPDTVTSIGVNAFASDAALSHLVIPDEVTTISSGAFQGCSGLGYIKFASEIPPTVSSATAFASIQTDCIIYVPTGYLEDYEDATNYPDPDTYQYVEY